MKGFNSLANYPVLWLSGIIQTLIKKEYRIRINWVFCTVIGQKILSLVKQSHHNPRQELRGRNRDTERGRMVGRKNSLRTVSQGRVWVSRAETYLIRRTVGSY